MTKDPKIIFVDDEPHLLDAIRQRIRGLRRTWTPKFFNNAEAALHELADADSAVVVTDWMMPGMDGLALCKQLQTLGPDQGAGRRYVIVLTGKLEIENVVEALGHGADDYVTKPCDVRELVARIEAGLRVIRLEDNLRAANVRLREIATTDELTRVSNRRHALETLTHETHRAARGAQGLGVILVDVDYFKKVNDSHGHHAGDEVLKEIAVRLRQSVRDYDCVARWGGEEFLLVCPGASREDTALIAERARQNICAEPVKVSEETGLSVSISAGTGSLQAGSSVSLQELLGPIDEALYAAKAAGRNCVRVAEIASHLAPTPTAGSVANDTQREAANR